jgi:hypothetical protein
MELDPSSGPANRSANQDFSQHFYKTPKSITVFQRAFHWTLS